MAALNEGDVPAEVEERISSFDESLNGIENVLAPLQEVPLHTVQAKLSSLEKAKVELVGAYAINSLFWMYLNVRGENPKEHGIKTELDRIRSYMQRVKEVQDQLEAEKEKPQLNKDASKRFIRSALWQQAHKQAQEKKGQEGSSSSHKRPNESQESTKHKKHKKGKKRR